MSSPFETFSSKAVVQPPSPMAKDGTGTGFEPTTPTSPKEEVPTRVEGDVYRSYSLMDVAFWDFGTKADPNRSFLSKFFGTPSRSPASSSSSSSTTGMDCSGGVCKIAGKGATPAPAPHTPSNGTWSAWLFGGGK